jgi:hypothetical protein
MKNSYLFTLLIILSLGFFSCETDIDVNAELEDITVLYAAIDPVDSVHYVKINKAFLQDNVSAIDLAGNANNFNYAPGEIIVTIDEYTGGGTLVNSNILTRTVNEVPKNPGIFDNSTNVLYKFVQPNINRWNTYRLKIINPVLGKEITSQTLLVKDITVTKPEILKVIAFWNGDVNSGTYIQQEVQVTTAADVGRVNATMIFNYTEFYTLASGLDSVQKSIRMELGDRKSIGVESKLWSISGENFFSNISANISPSTPFLSHREVRDMTLEFLVAGTELNIFMEVSEPSNNVNQEKPPYTNVDNGLGIFSSRTKVFYQSKAGSPSYPLNVNAPTVIKLKSLGLGFCFGSSLTSSYRCIQI